MAKVFIVVTCFFFKKKCSCALLKAFVRILDISVIWSISDYFLKVSKPIENDVDKCSVVMYGF